LKNAVDGISNSFSACTEMKEFFKSLSGHSAPNAPKPAPAKMLGPEIPALVLRSGMTLPIVDWDAMRALEPPTVDKAALDAFWTRLARSWLETLRGALDARYAIRESERFLMLGSLDESRANVVLEFVERARKRILMVLDGVAADAVTSDPSSMISSAAKGASSSVAPELDFKTGSNTTFSSSALSRKSATVAATWADPSIPILTAEISKSVASSTRKPVAAPQSRRRRWPPNESGGGSRRIWRAYVARFIARTIVGSISP